MNGSLIFAAAALSSIWLAVHLIVGGRQVAGPLLAATTLPALVRETQYLCWHFTSVAIAAIALFFFCALATGNSAFAICGTVLAAGFFVVGVGIVLLRRQSHMQFPQGWLFLPVALMGLLGL